MTLPRSTAVPHLAPSQTASALLLSATHSTRFSSSCPQLDALLSSPHASTAPGLAQGAVLELLGPPGVGKTRTALGFILSARFTALEAGGRKQGHVLVVDAEGSLSPSLIYDTAELFAEHNSCEAGSASLACDGIHYRRIYDTSLLVAFLYGLPTWLGHHPEVNLIVLDSLTSHLRPTSLDLNTKQLLFGLIKSTIALVTSQYSVSIILTTYLSLKLFTPDGHPSAFTREAEALLIPQLGDSWLPVNSAAEGLEVRRVVLYWDEHGERMAHLLASTSPARATSGAFTMDALGPCDHPPA